MIIRLLGPPHHGRWLRQFRSRQESCRRCLACRKRAQRCFESRGSSSCADRAPGTACSARIGLVCGGGGNADLLLDEGPAGRRGLSWEPGHAGSATPGRRSAPAPDRCRGSHCHRPGVIQPRNGRGYPVTLRPILREAETIVTHISQGKAPTHRAELRWVGHRGCSTYAVAPSSARRRLTHSAGSPWRSASRSSPATTQTWCPRSRSRSAKTSLRL